MAIETRSSEQELYKSRQWLKKMYGEEELSIRAIAKLCEVGYDAIRYYLIKFGIKRRKRVEVKIGPAFNTNVLLPHCLYKAVKRYAKMKEQNLSEAVREILLNTMIKEGFNPFKED